jgi:hypothetical protein
LATRRKYKNCQYDVRTPLTSKRPQLTGSSIVEDGERSHVVDPFDLVSSLVLCPRLESLMKVFGLDLRAKVGERQDPGGSGRDGLAGQWNVGHGNVGETGDGHGER